MSSAREYKPLVMIVDDSADDVTLLRHRLKHADFDGPLLSYLDSAEALAFLRELGDSPELALHKPGLMFLDLQMPRVHGFVFLKWVRSQPWLDDMKLIVLSGSDKPEDRERSLKLGADRYLVKFPPLDVFQELMASCLA
jgi:two-component system, response regulator